MQAIFCSPLSLYIYFKGQQLIHVTTNSLQKSKCSNVLHAFRLTTISGEVHISL